MKSFAIGLLLCVSAFADVPSLLENLPAPPNMPFQPPDASVVIAAAPIGTAVTAPPVFPKDTHALIRSAARKHQVPAAFVKSIVAAESNFNPDALSPQGAIGLMQLMPQTALQLGADPHIPEQNIDAGTRYLRILIDRYHRSRDSLRRVIAAYNAGPGMVDRYRGVPPFRETRQYVTRVLNLMRVFQRESAAAQVAEAGF